MISTIYQVELVIQPHIWEVIQQDEYSFDRLMMLATKDCLSDSQQRYEEVREVATFRELEQAQRAEKRMQAIVRWFERRIRQ